MIAGAGARTQSGRLTGMDRLIPVQRNARETEARCVGASGLFLRGERGYETCALLFFGVAFHLQWMIWSSAVFRCHVVMALLV